MTRSIVSRCPSRRRAARGRSIGIFANGGEGYLLVMTPKIRALVQALHQPDAGDFAAIFRAYDSEMLG
jgi:hypothetical protein